MIARTLFGVSAALLVSATAVVAQGNSGTAKADPDRQVCRRINDTGSRLGAIRVCHTAAEWAELRRQTKQTIDQIQNSRAANGQ